MSDTDTDTERPVLVETRDRVLVITINRPEQRNAVSDAVAEGIAHALDDLDGDDGLTLGVITGAGKGFCAGMDLKAFAAGERPWFEDRGFAGITRRAAAKPLIAAVEGFAVAGGLEVALACDLIVAARGARLGVPEVKRSLVAAGGGLLRLPRLLPRAPRQHPLRNARLRVQLKLQPRRRLRLRCRLAIQGRRR